MKQQKKQQIASQRVKQLAEENRLNGIDPGFYPTPNLEDYVNAIMQYLDEKGI